MADELYFIGSEEATPVTWAKTGFGSERLDVPPSMVAREIIGVECPDFKSQECPHDSDHFGQHWDFRYSDGPYDLPNGKQLQILYDFSANYFYVVTWFADEEADIFLAYITRYPREKGTDIEWVKAFIQTPECKKCAGTGYVGNYEVDMERNNKWAPGAPNKRPCPVCYPDSVEPKEK